jgi:hypothetical protein
VEVIVSNRLTRRAVRVAAATGIAFVAFSPAAAHAACYPSCGTSTPNDPGGTTVAAKTTKASTLPFTGGDVAGIAAIGAGAVLAGAVIVRQSRRRAVA